MRQVVTIFFLLVASSAYSQFSLRYGLCYEYFAIYTNGPIDIHENELNNVNKPLFVTEKKTLGTHFAGGQGMMEVAIPWDDENSIALSLGLKIKQAFSTPQADYQDVTIFDFPMHVMYRTGVLASGDSDSSVGFAAGAGYQYHYSPWPYGALNVISEFTFAESWALRLNADVTRYHLYVDFSSEGLKPVASLRHVGVSLLYNGF